MQRLQFVIGKEVSRLSTTQVSLSKLWFRQLPEKSVDELMTELQVKESKDIFKNRFK